MGGSSFRIMNVTLCLRCVVDNLIYGVALNDANYVTTSVVLGKCPYYYRWMSVLERCYSAECHRRFPTYDGCTVCEEWLTFSNFKAWMETQDWEGKVLDKDILGNGKLYSPETCCFVSTALNTFLVKKYGHKYPTGVFFNKINKKFQAQCGNPLTGKPVYCGSYDTPEEAHEAWRNKKLEFAKVVTKGYPQNIIDAVLQRYSKV